MQVAAAVGGGQVLQAEGVMVAPSSTARITPGSSGAPWAAGPVCPAGGESGSAATAPAARKPSLKWIFLPSA